MAATVDQKLLRQTKFPPEFNQKVDMRKVNVEVMKKWIAGKISEILGSEDDVVIELCFNLLEGSRFPDIKSLQISLTGFLDKDTARFCKELWNLCLSAQSNPQGVPKELLEAKKLELIQEKIDAEKAAEIARKRKEQEQTREREFDNIRQRERADRGRGRGAGRGGRQFDNRRSRDSRSPPSRRWPSPQRGPPTRREMDTYVPNGRSRRRSNERGRLPTRSPSRSISRSPPPRKRRRSASSHSPSLSRSRSPPKRSNRRPTTRSPSPNSPVGKGAPDSIPRGRDRSASHSDVSKSPSPSRRRRNRSVSTRSRSRTPPRRRRHKGRSYSTSRSRSRSRERRHGRAKPSERLRKSSSVSSDDYKPYRRADVIRNRKSGDDRRLSRSPDPSTHSSKRNQSHRSRSRSSSRTRYQKRRRSLQRYEPAARRHRNTSSVSSPERKRQKAIVSEEELSD